MQKHAFRHISNVVIWGIFMTVAPIVKKFYEALPFNFTGCSQKAADKIIESNSTEFYKPLHDYLTANQSADVLDIGCGAGWLSLNMAHHYSANVTGIDFNPVAVKRAMEIGGIIGSKSTFEVADLFHYQNRKKFDVLTSIGVLHHTDDCMGGLSQIINQFLKPGGIIFIGLYHIFGRKPFLSHFKSLKEQGLSIDELRTEYAKLDARFVDDEVHLDSWFRDQVLHPYESLHSLFEVSEVLKKFSVRFIGSSLDRYKSCDIKSLVGNEDKMFEVGERHLKEGNFFPGFFTVCGQKE